MKDLKILRCPYCNGILNYPSEIFTCPSCNNILYFPYLTCVPRDHDIFRCPSCDDRVYFPYKKCLSCGLKIRCSRCSKDNLVLFPIDGHDGKLLCRKCFNEVISEWYLK